MTWKDISLKHHHRCPSGVTIQANPATNAGNHLNRRLKIMSMRNVLFCALIALGPVAMPAVAQININIDLGVAPPAPRYEVVPAPRSGYAWAPGYWRWEGERHVWAQGRWIEARSGSYWVADRWEARNGRHHFEPGRWEQGARHEKVKHEGKGNEKGKGWAKGHDR